jgi:nucleoid-associated protein YgaU
VNFGAKVGPLPMGVWLLVGGGGLLIAWRSSKATAAAAAATPAIDPLPTGGGDTVSSWDNAPVVLSPVVNVAPPSVLVNILPPAVPAKPITGPKPIAHPPAPPRVPARPKPAPKPAPKRSYTVASGDTLSAISVKEYGTAVKWPLIYAANTSVIEAAARAHGKPISGGGHWIYPGTVLVIP